MNFNVTKTNKHVEWNAGDGCVHSPSRVQNLSSATMEGMKYYISSQDDNNTLHANTSIYLTWLTVHIGNTTKK